MLCLTSRRLPACGRKGDHCRLGRFEMRPRKPKAYTNPKTKVSSRLESTSIPGFKASGRFKQKLEAGKAKAAEENA